MHKEDKIDMNLMCSWLTLHIVVSDKHPPQVEYCPDDLDLTSSTRLTVVTWVEPVFTDDVGIVDVQKTHRSGKSLSSLFL